MDGPNFHYLDWVAMALTFAGVHRLGDRSRDGFLLMLGSNIAWVAVGYFSGSWAMGLGNALFVAINARGWWKWRPGASSEATAA